MTMSHLDVNSLLPATNTWTPVAGLTKHERDACAMSHRHNGARAAEETALCAQHGWQRQGQLGRSVYTGTKDISSVHCLYRGGQQRGGNQRERQCATSLASVDSALGAGRPLAVFVSVSVLPDRQTRCRAGSMRHKVATAASGSGYCRPVH